MEHADAFFCQIAASCLLT